MDNIYISIYLYQDTIHIFKSVIKALNNPKYIRLLIHETGNSLLLESYDKKSLTSFKTPDRLNDDKSNMRIYSKKLCDILTELMGWNKNQTYRIPGIVLKNKGNVIFDLTKANCLTINEE